MFCLHKVKGIVNLSIKIVKMDLKDIINQFFSNKPLKEVKPFGNGHINSTYKLAFENEPQEYILQKINTNVFTKPQQIVLNHQKLQEFIYSGKNEIEIPQLVSTLAGSMLYIDNDQGVWRMMNFIDKSYSVEVIENETQAYEAGNGFGWFAKVCSKLNPSDFHEAIKDFHRLSFRLGQLNDAIKLDKANRCESVKYLIEFYKFREKALLEIENLIDNKEIPIRVVHNDTKINNLLFRDKKAVAVIDLDTVGPGVIFYDYGDSIRTIANTAAEDEKNIDLVDFNLKAFESFTKGYLQHTGSILNPKEKELLYRAPILMTYIMGIRFLTDYLNGDVYYKTEYSNHNLVRSLVQKRFIELMEMNKSKIELIIKKYLSIFGVSNLKG